MEEIKQGETGEVVENILKVELRGNRFEVSIGTQHVPKLCTAIKLAEMHIENMMIAQINKPPESKIVTASVNSASLNSASLNPAAKQSILDKIRGGNG